MLFRLTVQNVALIDRAEVEFSEGLNVLSGETGAGKSVILDSIDFVLGAKADKSMIRYGADECLVRAEFSCVGETVRHVLEEFDIEAEDTLVISRKYTSEGKSSIKINGCGVTVAMLRRVSSYLVDVHGQSDHFFLLKESNQLKLLDSIAGEPVLKQKSELSALVAERKKITDALKVLGTNEEERNREADILRFQISEIERAEVREGEEEKLLVLKNRYQNAEKLLNALSATRDYLLSDGGSIDAVHGANRTLASVTKYDKKLEELCERLRSAADELNDVAEIVEEIAGELDVDEADVERVENRLDEIRALKKKYGATAADILAFCEKAKARFALLTDSGERFEQLNARLAKINQKIYKACVELSRLRKTAANGFTERVTAELKTLNISSARFEVEFDEFSASDAGKAGENGLDSLRFLFSANAGEPLKEMDKIISGGEMSRFMLAVKAQLSSLNEIGSYLFDEIDAGIGGKTARVVAEKFCSIARHTQIIAVSHSAQIAAFADRQFLIVKTEEKGKTHTQIRPLADNERPGEIARLAGGDGQGEFALKHAEELLLMARSYKKSHSI